MSSSPRALRQLVALVGAALLLAACGSSGATENSKAATAGQDPLVAAAKREGSVTWYSSIPQAPMDELSKAFEAKYGVKVDIVRGLIGALTQRLSAEQQAGRPAADVINLADPIAFGDMTKKGWLVPLKSADVPGFSAWPEKYVIDGDRIVSGIQGVAVAFNTNKVKRSDLKNWNSLLDPKYKKQIIMADPKVVPNWLALMAILRDKVNPDYLTRLAAQEPTLVDSAVPGAQQLAAGEAAIQFPTTVGVVQPLKDQGAPIDTVFLSPTTGVEQYSALIKGGPHPNAAKLLMSFIMSKDGQVLLNKGTAASVLPDVPGTLPLPKNYVAPDILGANQHKAEILKALGE